MWVNSTWQKDELLEYCRTTLEDDATSAFAHWQVKLDACAALLEMNPLETFRLNRDLYATLCLNHERRVKTAHMLVSVHGDWTSA